jgi:hypothetical protein
MGYRNYIASITKEEYDKIKDFTKEELYNYKNTPMDGGYVGPYDIASKRLYELGKYVDCFPKELFNPVFTNKELQDEILSEDEFYLVNKEFLEAVINRYSDKIKAYYQKLLDPILTDESFPKLKDPKEYDPTHVYEMAKHIQNMAFEWGVSEFKKTPPYDLTKGDEITTSWKYEYAQFELVRIYKTFDWENNIMIYYGY